MGDVISIEEHKKKKKLKEDAEIIKSILDRVSHLKPSKKEEEDE